MEIVSVREDRKYTKKAIEYFQKYWASDDSMMVYEDCIENTEGDKALLPQWYLLLDGEKIVGSAGLKVIKPTKIVEFIKWISNKNNVI